ncbi:hypothetical protein H2248_005892 [Termitomyces sp. 'cryptogamus']|nr:hypothetical protein H2248_005892 [Termitomyces sp. 'cryptogamus']
MNSVTLISIAISGLIAHSFLAYRFFRLTRKKIACCAFFVISVTIFAISLGAGIVNIKQNLTLNQIILHQSSRVFQALVLAWLILQTLLEAGLAVSVGYALSHCKPPFMSAPRHSALARVVRGFVQAGGIVLLFYFANLISSVAEHMTTVSVMFSLSIAPLYSVVYPSVFAPLSTSNISDRLFYIPSLLAESVSALLTSTDPTGIWLPTIPKAPAADSASNQNISLHSISVSTEVFSDSVRLDSGQRSGRADLDK